MHLLGKSGIVRGGEVAAGARGGAQSTYANAVCGHSPGGGGGSAAGGQESGNLRDRRGRGAGDADRVPFGRIAGGGHGVGRAQQVLWGAPRRRGQDSASEEK